jgi:hypothetical protein
MIGEVLIAINIIKSVLDIWDRVKPKQTAESAQRVAQIVEQRASTQDVAEVIQTLKVEANLNLSPTDADELISDVKYRWVLEVLKKHLKQNQGWNALDEPEFLLVMEKVMMTEQYIMGFVSGPRTAQGVDFEFDRWKGWLASKSGHPLGLLVYVYDNLFGISPDHIIGKKFSKLFGYNAIGGYLDLSQMKLEPHRGVIEKYNQGYGGLTLWVYETRDVLKELHDHYLQISGYFR